MARLFRLAGLGTRSTTGTRSEKTLQTEQAIPVSWSRASEYTTDQHHRDDEGASTIGTKSGLGLNKDPSMSYIILLCNSQTKEPIAIDGEARIDYDLFPSRGRNPEKRDESTLGDEVQSRAACRQSGRTKSLKSGRSSMTPKSSHLTERSRSKDRRDRSRSKSKRPPSKSRHDNGKNNNSNNRRRRSMSRRQGKFVSNKKKWNLSLGSGRFFQPRNRSLSVDRKTKKKGGQHVIRRPSLTSPVSSSEELIPRQVTRDNTLDTHAGHDTSKDRYRPRKGYHIDADAHSLIDDRNAGDDSYRHFAFTKRRQRHRDAETLEEFGSFDDSIYYGYKDGWLATYDRCLGTFCGFEVDDLPPSHNNGKEENAEQSSQQSSKMNWIKNPSCPTVDQSCLLVDIRNDVVSEIFGRTNEVTDPLSLDGDQENDGLMEPLSKCQ